MAENFSIGPGDSIGDWFQRRDLMCILFAFLASIAVAVSVFVEGPIIAYSGDGGFYLCYAHSVGTGNGFHDCQTGRLTSQTPLFPIILAMPIALGLEIIDVVRIYCIALAWMTAFVSARLLDLGVRSTLLFVLGGFTVALHPTVILWTTVGSVADPYFAGFGVLLLLAVTLYLRGSGGIFFVALAALLCMATRYFGLALVAAACLAMLSPLNPRPVTRRWRDALIAAAPSAILLAGWMVRSFVLTGCPTSCISYHGSGLPFVDVIELYFYEMGAWQFYLPGLAGVRWILILTALLGAAVIGYRTRRRATVDGRIVWGGAIIFLVVYSILPVGVYTFLKVGEPMNQRYVLPVAVIVAVIFVTTLDRLLPSSGKRRNRILGLVAIVWLAWIYLPLKNVGATMFHQHGFFSEGPTPTSKAVRSSAFVAYLKNDLPAEGAFVDNNFTQVFVLIHTNRLLPVWNGKSSNGVVIVSGALPGGYVMTPVEPYRPPPGWEVALTGRYGTIARPLPGGALDKTQDRRYRIRDRRYRIRDRR